LNVDLQNPGAGKDILVFAPQLKAQPAFRNQSDVWYLNGKLRGNLSNLHIESLQVSGLAHTKIDISGTVVGLLHPNDARGKLRIRQFTTTRNDVLVFFSPEIFPKNITLPQNR
jgi:hypothetical protein